MNQFPNDAFLHIYAQDQWHADAFIVGNAEALKALRDAIDRALERGHGYASCYVNDGEGYYTAVVKVDDKEKLDRLGVPYTDEVAGAQSVDNPIWPWDLPGAVEALTEARAWMDEKYGKQEREEIEQAHNEALERRKGSEPNQQ